MGKPLKIFKFALLWAKRFRAARYGGKRRKKISKKRFLKKGRTPAAIRKNFWPWGL